MLYHPAHHEALMALREAELARRAKHPHRVPAASVRQVTASVLRRVADHLDSERERSGAVFNRPIAGGL